jgi:hypothetical protein
MANTVTEVLQEVKNVFIGYSRKSDKIIARESPAKRKTEGASKPMNGELTNEDSPDVDLPNKEHQECENQESRAHTKNQQRDNSMCHVLRLWKCG